MKYIITLVFVIVFGLNFNVFGGTITVVDLNEPKEESSVFKTGRVGEYLHFEKFVINKTLRYPHPFPLSMFFISDLLLESNKDSCLNNAMKINVNNKNPFDYLGMNLEVSEDVILEYYFFIFYEPIKDSKRKIRLEYSHLPGVTGGKNIFLKDEISGKRCYFFTKNNFKDIIRELSHKQDNFVLSIVRMAFFYDDKLSSKEVLDLIIKDGNAVIFSPNEINNFNDSAQIFWEKRNAFYKWKPEIRARLEQLLIQSSQPIRSDSLMQKNVKDTMMRKGVEIAFGPDYLLNIPIMLVDEKNHKNRADSEDWRIYTHVNTNNGDFFQYFFFETEVDQEWPLYIRDFAMDYLAGAHVCKNSTVAVLHRSKEKVVNRGKGGFASQNVYIPRIKGKEFRPDPVPKDKNTIPKGRLLFNEEYGRIFGSHAKIWDLKIWSSMPELLRKSPKGVYLVGYGALLQLNECKTPELEQALLKKCAIFITPTLYKQLEFFQKSSKHITPQR